ncbi:hypothetical protein SAMN06298216_0172 [Spirosomataceae bacterium TFI 002]|nr:hypothetical protein SAMN06298216_0172 [Spirosomataceae bacterium TFI 002]
MGLKWLMLITLIVETIGFYYLKVRGEVAHMIFAIFHPIEFYLIALYYSKTFVNKTNIKIANIFKSVIPLLIFGIGFASLKVNFPLWFNFLTSSIFLIALSALYFNELLVEKIEYDLLDNPDFFISIGVLTFHSGSFLVMGLVNYIYLKDKELAGKVFSINHILNIIYYGLITYAFYIQWKSTKSSLSS